MRKKQEKPITLKKIVIIDDDALVRESTSIFFQRENFEVFSFSSGEEALKYLKNETVPVVICDEKMPGLSGTEVLTFLKELAPETEKILLTGSVNVTVLKTAINAGAIDYFIEKPWDGEQLLQIVNSLLVRYSLKLEKQELTEALSRNLAELESANLQLRNEMQMARKIHEKLLTGRPPETLCAKIGCLTIPSEEIDGDFYDFYNQAPPLLDIVFGDVMGKGIRAALVGTAVKSQLMRFAMPFSIGQSFTPEGGWKDHLLNPVDIVTEVDRAIGKHIMSLEYFCTLFYGRFDFSKSLFTYVDCGSLSPLLIKKDKSLIELKGDNLPIGILESEEYVSKSVNFEEGDLFVFYSDGITESRRSSNELYGNERLKNFLLKNSGLPPDELVERVKEEVFQFTGKTHIDDDMTIIAVRVQPSFFFTSLMKKEPVYFSSDFDQLIVLRDFVSNKLKSLSVSEDWEQQILVVVTEAFANIIKHSAEKSSKIEVSLDFTEDGMGINFSHQGKSFDPSEIDEPNFAFEKESGFGWYIIKKICDSVFYCPKGSENGWNHLKLFKYFQSGGISHGDSTFEDRSRSRDYSRGGHA